VILSEAVERHGEEHVYEVVTTDRTPEAVAQEVEAVVAGEREPSAGTVDYTDWLVGDPE
jgi:adenylate kinase